MSTDFDPTKLRPAGEAAVWRAMGFIQAEVNPTAPEVAAVMTEFAVSDKWARALLAWMTKAEWLTRTPDGQTFRYSIGPAWL